MHLGTPWKPFIGYTPDPRVKRYYTVLEMMADGWKPLGPPQRETWTDDGTKHVQWAWWLTRESGE